MNKWLNSAEEISNEIISLRRELHKIPEIGFDLYKTAEVIEKHLLELGLEPKRFAKTGIVAIIESKNPEGSVIGLRADMDGMPIEENTGLEFKSTHKGCMHSCGHDAHMAILLGAAKLLVKHKDKWKGKIKLIFQPAEELVKGAKKMISEGVMEDPEIDYMLSLHLWQPLETGKVGIKKGTIMASNDNFVINIFGKGAHAAMPHQGIDSIAAAADFIQTIQNLLARKVPSDSNYVLTFGKFNGGTKNNSIADKVRIEGTFRTFDTKIRSLITRSIKDCLESKKISYGINWEYHLEGSTPATVNDFFLFEKVRKSLIKIFDKNNIIEHPPILTSEDFSEYAFITPSLIFLLGGGGKSFKIPHHHEEFNIDEESLKYGVATFVQAVIDLSNNNY